MSRGKVPYNEQTLLPFAQLLRSPPVVWYVCHSALVRALEVTRIMSVTESSRCSRITIWATAAAASVVAPQAPRTFPTSHQASAVPGSATPS